MFATFPTLNDEIINPPGLEWSRLRCFYFFNGDSTKPDHSQATGWSVPGLRVLFYGLDKEYSRKVSRLAIPQLLNEINVLREPQQAAQRFKSVVMDPDVLVESMRRAAEADDGEEPFERYLERIHRFSSTKK